MEDSLFNQCCPFFLFFLPKRKKVIVINSGFNLPKWTKKKKEEEEENLKGTFINIEETRGSPRMQEGPAFDFQLGIPLQHNSVG